MDKRPTVFIGSSSEKLRVVASLARRLQRDAVVLRWDKNVFAPGRFALEDLDAALRRCDFALFVFAKDDIVKWRRRTRPAPRDNVVLEIGMALGLIGRRRLLLLYSTKDRAKIPSDLLGFGYVPLDDKNSNTRAVADACEIIRQHLIAEGLRELPADALKIVNRSRRSANSTKFAASTLHTLDVFAGDLSWLPRDLPTYKSLAQTIGVRIRFLTDTPSAPVIRQGKKFGLLFNEYPTGKDVRIRASLADAESESIARALIVQKKALRPDSASRRRIKYDYTMKVYSGQKDFPVIQSLSKYFEELFQAGRRL